MRLAILGDAHGNWNALNAQLIQARDYLGVEAAIQVGDLGLDRQTLEDFARTTRRFALPMHAIDGNHEDHAYLARAIRRGTIRLWAEQMNLFVQPRGSTIRVGESTVGFVGGALHVVHPQQHGLLSGAPNYLTRKQALMAAELFNRERPTLVVTHSCPSGIGIGMRGTPAFDLGLFENVIQAGFDPGPVGDRGESALRLLWDHLEYKPNTWVFGHFHVEWSVQIGETRFACAPTVESRSRVLWWDSDTGILEAQII